MKHPLISVITPCYNAGAVIAQTIESVINQVYKNWEMLIIDDCSTDNSAEIIHSYISKDFRIKYLRTNEPSGSPAIPRNIGIENSHGDYIAFLDSDDIWLPNKLICQLDFIKTSNAQFIYSDYEKIDETGNRNNRIIKMPTKTSFWDILETCSIPCLTVLLKKSYIGTTRFKNIPKEDYIFWIEILRKGGSAYNTGKVLALYREQSQSRSSNKWLMIKQQWYILRQIEGIKRLLAIYFISHFIVYGFLKYLK